LALLDFEIKTRNFDLRNNETAKIVLISVYCSSELYGYVD